MSGVTKWVTHDIRRTVATGMQRLGIPFEVIEAVQNRSLRGVAGVYQRHEWKDEKRDALERWARHVEHLITGEEAKVIDLPRRAASP